MAVGIAASGDDHPVSVVRSTSRPDAKSVCRLHDRGDSLGHVEIYIMLLKQRLKHPNHFLAIIGYRKNPPIRLLFGPDSMIFESLTDLFRSEGFADFLQYVSSSCIMCDEFASSVVGRGEVAPTATGDDDFRSKSGILFEKHDTRSSLFCQCSSSHHPCSPSSYDCYRMHLKTITTQIPHTIF